MKQAWNLFLYLSRVKTCVNFQLFLCFKVPVEFGSVTIVREKSHCNDFQATFRDLSGVTEGEVNSAASRAAVEEWVRPGQGGYEITQGEWGCWIPRLGMCSPPACWEHTRVDYVYGGFMWNNKNSTVWRNRCHRRENLTLVKSKWFFSCPRQPKGQINTPFFMCVFGFWWHMTLYGQMYLCIRMLIWQSCHQVWDVYIVKTKYFLLSLHAIY